MCIQKLAVHKQNTSLLVKEQDRKRKAMNTPQYFKHAEKCARLSTLVGGTTTQLEAPSATTGRVMAPVDTVMAPVQDDRVMAPTMAPVKSDRVILKIRRTKGENWKASRCK